MACAFAVLVHTRGTAAPTSDSGVYVGLARNLHGHGSLTAPTDPNWLLVSPAQVAARRGFVPIPDFAPVYSALGALTPDPVDGFSAAHVLALFVVLGALGAVVHRATRSLFAALLAQMVFAVGPTGEVPGLPHFTSLDLASVIQADLIALAFFVAAFCLIVVRSHDERPVAVIATLLAAATLTRFAYWGGRRLGDRSRCHHAAAAGGR